MLTRVHALQVVIQVQRVAQVGYDSLTQPSNNLPLANNIATCVSWKTKVCPDLTFSFGLTNKLLVFDRHLRKNTFSPHYLLPGAQGSNLTNQDHIPIRYVEIIYRNV